MAQTVEILNSTKPSHTAAGVLRALRAAFDEDGCEVTETSNYKGDSEWLVMYGVGFPVHERAFKAHVASGRKAMTWDFGYLAREKLIGPMRVSINRPHPQHLIDLMPRDDTRFQRLGVNLREDFKPDGPIILVGMGSKSRLQFHDDNWEAHAYIALKDRFPERRIVYRPKRPTDKLDLPCERNDSLFIENVLKGASLVVCRHSNVAVDAVIAGVPFEAEDGAAVWLRGKEYNFANRLEFLQRLAWLQWRPDEASEAWAFLKGLKIEA